MYKLRYLLQARYDLVNIQRYISVESGSAKTAYLFVSKIREKCKNLSTLKGKMGQSRPDLGEGIRSYAFGNYVIFFRYQEDWFEVVKIIQGHRDIVTIFKG